MFLVSKILLEAQDVRRGFTVGGETVWALGGLSMTVAGGMLTILKGRSGSGKTTLINLLGALDYPTEGDVLFDGSSIVKMSEGKRDNLRRTQMGFVFQSVALVGMMTAFENVEFILRINGYPEKERESRVTTCLEMVGLADRMHHMPSELSGGEQQRVAIARGFAHKPRIVFADEPTAELDTNTGLQIIKVFKDLIDHDGTTVVISTHDPELVDVADKVYELADGVIINE